MVDFSIIESKAAGTNASLVPGIGLIPGRNMADTRINPRSAPVKSL
jgi:hypothetical protein